MGLSRGKRQHRHDIDIDIDVGGLDAHPDAMRHAIDPTDGRMCGMVMCGGGKGVRGKGTRIHLMLVSKQTIWDQAGS